MNKGSLPLLAIILTASLIVDACTKVGPDYQPPALAVPDQWSGEPGNQNAKLINCRWWLLFADPVLTAIIEKATTASHDLRIAEANVRAARAQRLMDGGAFSSSASLEGSRARRSSNGTSAGRTYNLFETGFDAGWELDVFGGLARQREADEATLAAVQEDYRDVLVSLQAEVARNYLELRGAEARLAVARETIAAGEKTVELIEGRYKMGIGSELDLVDARTELALGRAKAPALEITIKKAAHQLALLTGQLPEALAAELAAPGSLPEITGTLSFDLPSEVLRQRPDIRAAERRLASATAGIGVAAAELYPRFSLAALGGLQSVELSDLLSSASRFWTIGPSINLPLFNQGKLRAGREKKEAERDRTLSLYEKAVLTAFTEVEDALTGFHRERETERILSEAVASGKKAVAIADGLFAMGLTDFLHVLQSRRALYQSQDQYVQSRLQVALDVVILYKAFGGGWQNVVVPEQSTDCEGRAKKILEKTQAP